jgi:6-phosphogluconolactonase
MLARFIGRVGRLALAATVATAFVAATASASGASENDSRGAAGAVFTLSNAASGNEVLQFFRAANGSLFPAGAVSTGGLGSGGSLGNQGALALSGDHHWLFAVNAGSDTVASLRVGDDGVHLVDVESTRGDLPISVTVHGNLLYVLNAGGTGSIRGLRIGAFGHLSQIHGSSRPLTGSAVAPAQIAFSPNGHVLAVTEKDANKIATYVVKSNGKTAGPKSQVSSGQTPFGFAFGDSGRAYISEAFGGAIGKSAVSSYRVASDGDFSVVSASVPDGQTAACWVVVTDNERFLYTTNTGSASVSSYRIGANGHLSLLHAVAAATDPTPIDLALSRGDRFLYTLNAGGHTIGAYAVGSDGGLSLQFGISGLPASANGLAAF